MKKQALYQHGDINGNTLKWIGIISMAIDHMAAGFLNTGILNMTSDNMFYNICRMIGRLAFPIFVFLLIQGFQHTSNRRRYFIQLIIFAVISEIPYDLALNHQFIDMNGQNVFFTLASGLIGLHFIEKYDQESNLLGQIISGIIPLILANLFNFDYGIYGVIFIYGMGILRDQKIYQTIFGVIMGLAQAAAIFAFIPIWFYNGKRGKQNKWLFYLFYPSHLLIIAFIIYLYGY